MTAMRPCQVAFLGQIDCLEAWALQQGLAARRAEGAVPDMLLLLEHPHVITLGRRGKRQDVLLSDEALAHLGIQVHEVDRGGEVTYHGPGQLVGYPIVSLRDWGGGPVHYVRTLESILIDTLGTFGIPATRVEGITGVFVPGSAPGAERKIASIGVRVARGVTSHGFALNVNTDLRYFDHIVPCGMPDRKVTSMAQELGCAVDIRAVAERLAEGFGHHFGFAMRCVEESALRAEAQAAQVMGE